MLSKFEKSTQSLTNSKYNIIYILIYIFEYLSSCVCALLAEGAGPPRARHFYSNTHILSKMEVFATFTGICALSTV